MVGDARQWVVDSVEEGIAAVNDDDGRILHVPVWILPSGAREGDVLSLARTADGDGACTVRIAVDRAATDEALRISREQVERRLPHDPGGDIIL
jgi:hypothetical protein